MLAYGGLTGYSILYDLVNNEPIQELYGHSARISDIDFSNNGKLKAAVFPVPVS